ncbi:hypothetical protein HPP92_003686 [Vanilla planifolia]|uniref:Uncharacterized protein n=1 Tax=Vanilla planifolia TaxID=51239 RepID=A0A835S3N4_VANPL|nr:hypothetical protein HPP92_003686 [Vanilla planifolia]
MDEPSCSSLTSQEPISASEESGWTSYFEDFLDSEKRSISSSAHGDDSSLVSDAASSAGWENPLFLTKPLQRCEKLISFKTKKARRVSDEDPLKDTASSPVNSPKVGGEFSQFDMNAGKKGSTGDSSQRGEGRGGNWV